jgi:predicted permease
MSENIHIVLSSVVEVFGLVGIAYLYARRLRLDTHAAMRIGMDIFVPCLAFSALMESSIDAHELGIAAGATLIQIGSGLVIGWIGLRLIGWGKRRELLMPIAFVNSANIPFPLLLTNFGAEGLSRGVLCYMVTNLTIFSVGLLILHGGGRLREAFREPALWATALAAILRLLKIEPPEMVMRVPRLAGMAAVPLMLVLFGDALSRTRLTSFRVAAVGTLLRYASGAVALAITLTLLRPEGMLRKILILYALLPSAVVNVILTQKAGRDAESVASTILLATLVSVVLLPLILIFVHGD